jgi:tRNA(Ile2) C34 agmatinyltransferase TiaS
MGDSWAKYQARWDNLLPDHFPSCPRCGNLCGRLAVRCADCGARLFEPDAAPLGEALTADKERED